MQYKDYYKILGLERGAGADEIKKAYRLLARKYHPDVSKEADAEERFKEVAEAYEVLKDPEKRAAYDQLGTYRSGQEFRPPPDWERHFAGREFEFGTGRGGFDFSDFFSELFGGPQQRAGHARSGRGFASRGQDVEASVELALEQALLGTEASFQLAVPEIGAQGVPRRVPRTIKVRIPKGVTDGQTMRVPGKGGHGTGGAADGDLYLHIAIKPHPLYKPVEHDLYLEVPVSPWEAALGANVVIPTPEGKAHLRIPAGVRAGQKLRLAGKGLPKPGGRGSGDLYAVIQIAVPKSLSEREKSLFEELAQASRFDPRSHFGEH
jgi:curved DNA-binding protein